MPSAIGWGVYLVADTNSQVITDILRIEDRLSDHGVAGFLEGDVDTYLKDRIHARFLSEGDDASKQWLPLATATEAFRAAAGYGSAHPINIRTGDMFSELLDVPGDVRALGGSGAELSLPGSGIDSLTAEKVSTAQIGKAAPNTPPRPVLALSGIDEEDITTDLMQYILSGVISARFVFRL